MREIKFRVWDNIKHKMLKDFDWEWIAISNEGKLVRPGYTSFEESEIYGELMQFTGIKDSKGYDIYEDDICELSCPSAPANGTEKGVIRFRNGQFELENKDRYWTMDDVIRSNFALKIIGNIHEENLNKKYDL